MAEAYILKSCITVEMLESFFEIDIILMVVSFTGVFHILLYIKVNAVYCINQLNKALKVGIYIILDRYAEQIRYRLHRSVGAVCNCCINTVRAVIWYFCVSIAHNGEKITLFAHRIDGSNQHGIGAGNLTLFQAAGINTHQQNVYTFSSFPFRRLLHLGLRSLNIVERGILTAFLEIIHLIIDGDEVISYERGDRNEYTDH
ncbi:hypothetical protein D3C78_1232700 [compost metagenome]